MLSASIREDMSSAPDSELRGAFNASWTSELDSWRKQWPEAGKLLSTTCALQSGPLNFRISDLHVLLSYHHIRTILLSISLRFSGPARPILEQCRQEAIATVRIVKRWEGKTLIYGSNAAVTSIS